MTNITTRHLRGGGHVTIIRDLDDPRDAKPPAWLRDARAEALEEAEENYRIDVSLSTAGLLPRVQTITNPEVGA